MPVYEFKCTDCGQKFEEFVFSINSPLDSITCPDCESKSVEKLMSASAPTSSGSAIGGCGPLPSGGFG